MRYLTITRQAVRETECEAVLKQSMNLTEPLGMPTVLFNPKDITETAPRALRRLIRKKMQSATDMGRCFPAGTRLGAENPGNINPDNITRMALYMLMHERPHPDSFFSYSAPVAFPRMNGVLFQPIGNSFEREFFLRVKPLDLPDTAWPGFDSQHNFFNLWHEYGHGYSGGDEAGADYIAALVCRRAFADCTFLKAQADMRAFETILLADEETAHIERYGWPCVEAIDSIVAMKQEPSWAAIDYACQTLHTMPRQFNSVAVLGIYKKLQDSCDFEIAEYSVENLGLMTGALLRDHAFSDPAEIMIAERFRLAAHRLSQGHNAYYKDAIAPMNPLTVPASRDADYAHPDPAGIPVPS